MTTYVYSIQTDFPNHAVASDRLTAEITSSAIVTALDHIDTSGDDCSIVFKADLSSGDKTVLDGLVAAHSGQSLPTQAMLVSLDGPKQTDGSPFFSPCMFPSGVFLYICGAGDDPDDGRGNGTHFLAQRDTAGNAVVEWQFNDLVYMAGGGCNYISAEAGDWGSLEVVAPATPVTPNGTNTGNCNVVDGVIVPAAGDGAYDVDLDDAVPVPAQTLSGYNGYWEWDYSVIGKGTVSVGAPGTAHFHLLAVEMTLVRYANKLQFLGTDHLNLSIPAVEPKVQLPQWIGRLTLHNENGHTGLKTTWFLFAARVLTT